jgi:hypothetical protein
MNIAEGCTRLCIKMNAEGILRGLGMLCGPVLTKLQSAIDSIQQSSSSSTTSGGGSGSGSGALEVQMQRLARGLIVLAEIVKYLDGFIVPPGGVHPLSDLLNAMWPLLQAVAQMQVCRMHPDTLKALLLVHERIVGSFGDLIEPELSSLINVVVQAYCETFSPFPLQFVAVVVEKFGAKHVPALEMSFCALLTHLTNSTCGQLTKIGIESSPSLVSAFFEMVQRYLLFCPAALVNCPQFELIFEFAVACLTQCKGERDSTRSATTFLSQLIGRKGMRFNDQRAVEVLLQNRHIIDSGTAKRGKVIVGVCLQSLGGGGTSSLNTNFSDLLYAIVTHVIGADSDEGGQEEVGGGGQPKAEGTNDGERLCLEWVFSAFDSVPGAKDLGLEDKHKISSCLFLLAKSGLKERVRFRELLLDFRRICRGKMSCEELRVYTT